MRKTEEQYMKHINATGGADNKQENVTPTKVTINEVTRQKMGQYSHRPWRTEIAARSHQIQETFRDNPGKTEKVARSRQTQKVFKDNIEICPEDRTKKVDNC